MRTLETRIAPSAGQASPELQPPRPGERTGIVGLVGAGGLRGGRGWRLWVRRAGSWRVGGAGLVVLCLAVYLSGFAALPAVDRDESRFAQASRQMLESVTLEPGERDDALHSGGLVVPFVQERARLNKPPLIYWAQAGSAWALSRGRVGDDAVWMYRVPSVLAAVVAVLATWRLGSAMFDPRVGWLGGAMLAVCPVMVWEARQARADMVLLASTTVAMLALHAIWRERRGTGRGGWWVVFWVAVGAGVLTKGPITPMVAGLTCVVVSLVSGRWAWLGRLHAGLGVVIVAAVVVPWVVAVAGHVGFERYVGVIWDEVLGRSMEPKEGHWGPPGYHLVLVSVLFWPGSLLTALGVRRAWLRSRAREGGKGDGRRWRLAPTPEAFLLAWVAPAWVVFELVSTKLPHYTLPLYPALALLSARAVFAGSAGRLRGVEELLSRVGYGAWLGIGAVLSVVGGVGAFVAASGGLAAGSGARAYVAGGVVAGACCVIVCAVLMLRARQMLAGRAFVGAQVAGVAWAGLLGLVVAGLVLPRIEALWVAPRVADLLEPGVPVAAVGYHEDSLVFATRGRLAKLDEVDVRGWLAAHPGGVVVVGREAAAGLGLVPVSVGSVGAAGGEPVVVSGFNYSRGEWVELVIARGAVGEAP